MRRGAALAALLLVPAALVGCSSDGDDPRTPAIENVANRVIVPAYEDAATSSTALAAATNAFCAQPSPSSLT